jgi:hypothetical protein
VSREPNFNFQLNEGGREGGHLHGCNENHAQFYGVKFFILVLCLTSCCLVLLQDPNHVFPIGYGLDDLYSSLNPVVDFVPSCALALLVFQFYRL